MMNYHSDVPKSTASAASRQSATRPLRFSSFAGRRHFPPIPIARQIRPSKRAYLALPLAFFDCQIADQALALASRYSTEVFDPRPAFADNSDWRKRCGGILRRCSSLFCLLTTDRELAHGAYAEVAYAHALGLPVHVISWRLRGKPKLELGGEIVSRWDWTPWRAAEYRPAEKLTRRLSWETLRQQFPWLEEKAVG